MKAAIAKIRGPGRPSGRAIRSRRAPTWTPAQARGSNRLFAPQLDGATRPNPRKAAVGKIPKPGRARAQAIRSHSAST